MGRTTSADLNELGQRVAAWREKAGGRGSTIPDQLWADAVCVARVNGVWATAKALRFNYGTLRDRVKDAAAPAKRRGTTVVKRGKIAMARGAGAVASAIAPHGNVPPSFIALEAGQFGGAGRTVIDLVGRHGDRMRVDVASGVDVMGLIQTLWSGPR